MTAESRDRSHNENWVEKRTKEEEPNKEKPPASIEGKMRVAGERFFAYAQNDSLVGR